MATVRAVYSALEGSSKVRVAKESDGMTHIVFIHDLPQLKGLN